ncbi:MAG: hypothetical protein ACTSRI_04570 [Promethearchaeota archaeon]
MVSEMALLEGLTATGIILSSTIFGLLSFYHGKKLKAKLLFVAGLIMIFIGLFWLGPFSDFIMILTTQKNLNPVYLYGLLSYMWVAPAIVIAMYLGSELIMPKKKKVLVSIYAILGIIFEYFLWFDTIGTFKFGEFTPGEDIIDSSFVTIHPTFFFIAFFLVSVLIFEGIGFAIKAKQSTGELRKKFMFLSIGFIIFVACGALDSLVAPGPLLGVIRAIMMTFALWMYLGLKT